MNKQEFLAKLRKRLSCLPQQDVEERLTFYSEMIDDRIEEGILEEDAVCEIGDIDKLMSQIVAEIPLTKLAKEKVKLSKRLKAWEIILLVLGSPIWFSLLVAALAVIFSIYVCVWSVIISLWSVFGALICCAFSGIFAGIVFATNGNVLTGIATIGAALVCAGLSIFMFYGCNTATKGVLVLTKKFMLWIKNCFIKRSNCNE